MRVTICDVCEEQMAPEIEPVGVTIPNGWVMGPDAEEGSFSIDVCSPGCLLLLARQLGPEDAVAGETADQGDDGDTSAGQFVPVPAERPTFVTPVKVKTRSEHD